METHDLWSWAEYKGLGGHPLVGSCQAQKSSLAQEKRIFFRVIIKNDNRDFRLKFSILLYTKIILAMLYFTRRRIGQRWRAAQAPCEWLCGWGEAIHFV